MHIYICQDDNEGLKTEQINFLIDVVDNNGDGTVCVREREREKEIRGGVVYINKQTSLHQVFHNENMRFSGGGVIYMYIHT